MKRFLFALLYLATMVLPFLSIGSAAAVASSGYTYTDANFTAISGPGAVTFDRTGTPNYYLAHLSGGKCDTIVTPKIGAATGTLYHSLTNAGTCQVDTGGTPITIAPPGGSNAQANAGLFLDHSLINAQVHGKPMQFLDNKIDDDLTFKLVGGDDCTSQSTISSPGFTSHGKDQANASANATLTLYAVPGGGNNRCLPTASNIQLSDNSITITGPTVSAYQTYFVWADSGTITTSDTSGMFFTAQNSGDPFLSTGGRDGGDSACQSQITADPANPSHGTYTIRTSDSSGPQHEGWPSYIANATLTNNNGCYESKPLDITIADPVGTDGKRATEQAPGSAGVGGTGGSNTAPTINCHTSWNPLTWLLCPAVDGMVKIVGALDNFINSQLVVGTGGDTSRTDPTQMFCGATSSCPFYNAWNSVRLIGLGLLVIVGLVIVIAQASGSELVDAYTVRKALPRFVVVAIGLSLSWSLMHVLVDFTNALGFGIRWLIYQPFTTAYGSGNIGTLGGGGEVAANLVGAAAITTLGIVGLLSFAATAALAVFIAFLVLIIRQLVIIVLVILAPIAIVAYVLPNTKKLYDVWGDWFFKALLMFPIISAFIAAGRVFSLVALHYSGTGYGGGALSQLIGYAAYFAPYFLLPLTFRFAGGLLGTIGGFVNDRHRGAFDRLKNYRGKKAQQNIHDLKEGNRLKSSNWAARRFNATSHGIANLPSAGLTPWKMPSRYQAGMSQHKMTAMAEFMEKSAAWKAIQGNDDYLQATMKNMGGGDTESDWRRYLSSQGYSGRSLEQGVAAIRTAKRDTNDEVFKAAAVVANASTGTGWKEGGDVQMLESINEAAEGDRDMAARMLAEMRGRAMQTGRLDLGGVGFGTQVTALNDMYTDAHQGNLTDAKREQYKRKMAKNVLFTKGPGALISARGDAIKHLAPQVLEDLNEAHQRVAAAPAGSGQRAEAERALAQQYASIASIHDSMMQASPENARILADTVLDARLGSSNVTVMDNIEAYRNTANQAFMQARKDFDARQYMMRQAGEAAQAAQAGGNPNQQPGG